MTTLIIGSSGYLGQQVTRHLMQREPKVIATHHTTPKFTESESYNFYKDTALPLDSSTTVVIFAAAVEMNQPADRLEAAIRRLLEQISTCRFVYISSDAVFSGRKGEYTENDSPDPINAYGHNLVLCERLVQEMVADSCIVRPSYIYGFVDGELDARLARTRDRLLQGETCTLYDDYYKSPLSVQEVAGAVVHLAQSTIQGPIHVAGPRMSAYTFQRRAMDALGVDSTKLFHEPMPDDPTLMRDTSLDSAKWWSICQSEPLSIEYGLKQGNNIYDNTNRWTETREQYL
ncbi:MAG: sugar nucleotide-binding protein [Chloroflexota bacterium]